MVGIGLFALGLDKAFLMLKKWAGTWKYDVSYGSDAPCCYNWEVGA